MNRNQEKGVGKQIKGTIKDVAGKLTGDRILQGEGKGQKAVGKVQEKVGNTQQKRDEDNLRKGH